MERMCLISSCIVEEQKESVLVDETELKRGKKKKKNGWGEI